MFLAREQPGDRTRTEELLDQALSIYRELGMDTLRGRGVGDAARSVLHARLGV